MLLHCYTKLHIEHALNTRHYAPFVDQGPLEHPAFSMHATRPFYLIFLQLFFLMKINVKNIFLTQNFAVCTVLTINLVTNSIDQNPSREVTKVLVGGDLLPTF